MFQFIFRQVLSRPVSTVVVTGVAAEVTTGWPFERFRRSGAYHAVADQVVTPWMRSSWVDPEVAHEWALRLLQSGWAPRHKPSALEQRMDVSNTIWGVTFSNPIGCAAGFDKNGVAVEALLALGFGFVEIGSVTPQPQDGNERPRVFRLPYDEALINRYGCNSHGIQVVEQNLQEFYQKLQSPPKTRWASWSQSWYDSMPPWLQSVLLTTAKTINPNPASTSPSSSPLSKRSVLGINIARNRLGDASDFGTGVRALASYADYLVLNISSPNTPGLRQELQYDAQNLRSLLQQVVPLAYEAKKPLLVKISPDTAPSKENAHNDSVHDDLFDDDREWKELGQLLLECNVDGIVVSNTTTARPQSLLSPPQLVQQDGGLSGKPLADRSTECIRKLYASTQGQIPIIGVGGVRSGKDVYDKLKAGASLVQVYTAMVYEGPGLVSRLRHELATIMLQNGQRHMDDVIGQDHEEIAWAKRQERSRREQEAETKNHSFVDE